MQRECEASVVVHAPPEAVWSVISDVTRVGEWSGECRGGAWIPPSNEASVGARFRGRNRRGGMRWTRVNEVLQADRPGHFRWKTVKAGPYPDSVEWAVALEAVEGGTKVTEGFRVVVLPRWMEAAIGIAMPAHKDRTQDLADDLGRLKALVESELRAA
ncbi:MAG: SRPBCC family protein [Acidimicrobiales bacterium]